MPYRAWGRRQTRNRSGSEGASAAVVAVNMVVAVYLVHRQELFTLSKSGGWALELQGFYFLTALALVLLGAGRFSVGGAGGRLN